MQEGFRASMAWLHTWCGLFCGWLLCVIFFTGSLSVFREPISRWMQATPMIATVDGAERVAGPALDAALDLLRVEAVGANFWRLELPERPGDAFGVAWGGTQGRGAVHLHPLSGLRLAEPWGRATEGGRHFMSFHYMLQWRALGYWVVGGVSMGMLVALISGVVIHRRLFLDFFLFRPGRGPRAWLDAHNVSAVLTLPFQLMIVYTGLAVFYTSYMPWPLRITYGATEQAYERFHDELAGAPASRLTRQALPPLGPLLQQAEALMRTPASMLLVVRPGQLDQQVRVIGAHGEAGGMLAQLPSVGIDEAGELHLDGAAQSAFTSLQVHQAMEALHFARVGGWGLKWLYFGLGLLGTLMIASGTLLFSLKRRRKSAGEFGVATLGLYRLIEALNVCALAGIGLASIGYLYGNRLLSASLAGREAWEVRVFLLVWLASLVHALCRRPSAAWVEQLSLVAVLCGGLPLLNALTTGQHLGRYLAQGEVARAGVELVALGFALLAGLVVIRLRGRARA